MNQLVLFALFLCSASAMADGMAPADHKALLQLLVGDTGLTRLNENRTYYFAGSDGMVIEVTNSPQSIGLSFSKGGDADGPSEFGIDFGGSSLTSVALGTISDGATTVEVTEYFQNQGAKDVYSTTEWALAGLGARGARGARGFAEISLSATTQTLWSYDSSDTDESKWHFVSLAQPQISSSSADDIYILSLTPQDTVPMGKQAIAKTGDKRDPGEGDCDMTSQYIMECSWSLPTGYSPDTLEGVFSIKDGKISQLLSSDIVPGC